MPSPGNQFLSDEFGDIEDYFVSDYNLIDQYIGDTLWIWGNNYDGQLGINAPANLSGLRSTPVTTILGGTNWKSIAGGSYHTIALKTDGTLWCWGANYYGQLGVNDTTTRFTPVTTILGGNNWKSIACGGYHTVALKTDGSLWTWGSNGYGRLGVNDTIYRSTPVTTILGGKDWKYVSAAYSNTAAIKTDGSLWIWGRNSIDGELGVNDTQSRSTPVTTILGGNNWKSVIPGLHTMALTNNGTLWVWGWNAYGQLGINDTTGFGRVTPVTTIHGGTNWKSVNKGYSHSLAIKTDGTLWTWGGGTIYSGMKYNSGQLGVNDTVDRFTPVTTILGGNNWKLISGGFSHTSAIKTDGTLWVWGGGQGSSASTTLGQLGINDTINRSTPVTTILGGNNWKSIAPGTMNYFTVALTAGQSVDFS